MYPLDTNGMVGSPCRLCDAALVMYRAKWCRAQKREPVVDRLFYIDFSAYLFETLGSLLLECLELLPFFQNFRRILQVLPCFPSIPLWSIVGISYAVDRDPPTIPTFLCTFTDDLIYFVFWPCVKIRPMHFKLQTLTKFAWQLLVPF